MRTSSIRPEKYSPQIALPPIRSAPEETAIEPVAAAGGDADQPPVRIVEDLADEATS
jgi:hypothetical protein